MSIVLIRVDERLIHGQVIVGWGERLHVKRIIVVDGLQRHRGQADEHRPLGSLGGRQPHQGVGGGQRRGLERTAGVAARCARISRI